MSAPRFASVGDYLASVDPAKARTIRSVIDYIVGEFPGLDSKISWNVPTIHRNGKYVAGICAYTHHLTFSPWSPRVIAEFKPRLDEKFVVLQSAFQLPIDWKVDKTLLKDLVLARLAELDTPSRGQTMTEASKQISKRIRDLGDWRGDMLTHLRQLIHDADPDIQEEWKWEKPKSPGTPVFSHDGIVCTGESYKQVVKLTFARGASLKDPKKLFNSSLDGNVRRAIDMREGETINEAAFKQLIRSAVAANAAALKERAARKKTTTKKGKK